MKLISFQMREAVAERNNAKIISLAAEMFDDKTILDHFSPSSIEYCASGSEQVIVTVCLGFTAYQWAGGEPMVGDSAFELSYFEVRA